MFATGSIRIEPGSEAMEDFDKRHGGHADSEGLADPHQQFAPGGLRCNQRVEAFGAKGMIVSDNLRATSLEGRRRTRPIGGPLLHFFIDRYWGRLRGA